MDQIETLAREFARLLAQDLGHGTMRTVIERNRFETSANCCHSHDFCDANMIMDQAFITVKGYSAFQGDGEPADADITLWNAAWDMAKRQAFFS